MGETVVQDGKSGAVWIRLGYHQVLGESRFGASAGPPVAGFPVDFGHLFAGELIDVGPHFAEQGLVIAPVAFSVNPTSFMRSFLFDVEVEANGCGQRKSPASHVSEPIDSIDGDFQEQVSSRSYDSAWVADAAPCSKGFDLESDLLKNEKKETAMFEAVATVLPVDKLVLERRGVEQDGSIQQDIQVLEWHRSDVGHHDRLKGFEVGPKVDFESDSPLVGGKIYFDRHPTDLTRWLARATIREMIST